MFFLFFLLPLLVRAQAKYSYLSLEASQDLSIGISPGNAVPVWDPSNIYWMQVKSRTRNEFKAEDDRKDRFDLDYIRGTITLSHFSDLCVSSPPGLRVGLYPCNGTTTWQLWPFFTDPNTASVLKLSDGVSCLTVMRCNARGKSYCDANSNTPAVDANGVLSDALPGSFLRFKICAAFLAPVQVFLQQLDCAVGCAPFMKGNGVCDSACDVAVCGFDNGDCGTVSPTPPTAQPSQHPGSTRKPTFPRTPRPTTVVPSPRPSLHPSQTPSIAPSPKPTTQTPSQSPGVQCPPPGQLDYCAAHTQRICAHNPVVSQNCTFCYSSCLPKTDPRVCTIPQLYSTCPVTCPSDVQRAKCPGPKTAAGCMKATPWRKTNCAWCRVTSQCIGGKNVAACINPGLYAHCGIATKTPTGACVANKQKRACRKAGCKWIGAVCVT